MVTTAAEHEGPGKRAGGVPISAHPAFPAIVALWFSALLGLGTLVLPLVLLERLVDVSGLAALLPAAEPPLGFTARATAALGGACLGAFAGLLLARLVARGEAPPSRIRYDDARRPISAHDEFEEEGIRPPRPLACARSERRSLSLPEDDGPSEYLLTVPLPGHDPYADQQPDDEEDKPLELGDFDEHRETDDAQEETDFTMTEPGAFSQPEPTFADRTATGGSAGDMPRAFDPLPEQDWEPEDEFEPVDALPFSPPSLRRTPEADAVQAHSSEPEPVAEADPPMPRAFEPEPATAPQLVVVDSGEDHEHEAFGDEYRPLEDLGLVQLATRLGCAIERRRALRAERPVAPARPPAFVASEIFDAAEAEEAARARADFFGAPQGREDTSDTELPPLAGRGHFDPFPPDADYDDDEGDEDYSSLLTINNPFRRKDEFVRAAETDLDGSEVEATSTAFTDPAAETPPIRGSLDAPSGRQPTARNAADTERELRAALETLQRMSGAA